MIDEKEEGLLRKYSVRRIGDINDKHQNCFFFVLDIDHDPIARSALKTYMDEARKAGYEKLADDLYARMRSRET